MDTYPSARDAIGKLYERYADDVYRYARFTMGREEDACDVVQEVFLRAFRSWEKFRGDAAEKTWLLQIARNVMYDKFRKRRSEHNALRSAQAAAPSTHWQSSVEHCVAIESAMECLGDAYRQVVVLRHIEALSVSETAQVLGWSESKVRSTTHRALLKLRQILDEGHGAEVFLK